MLVSNYSDFDNHKSLTYENRKEFYVEIQEILPNE